MTILIVWRMFLVDRSLRWHHEFGGRKRRRQWWRHHYVHQRPHDTSVWFTTVAWRHCCRHRWSVLLFSTIHFQHIACVNVSKKIVCQTPGDNCVSSLQIFKILSLLETQANFQQNSYNTSHCTVSMLPLSSELPATNHLPRWRIGERPSDMEISCELSGHLLSDE